MELEIENKLQEKYKNLIVEVEFIEFRKYLIKVKINNEYAFEFIFTYDAKLTFHYNINIIEHEINTRILNIYQGGIINE